MVSHVTMSSKFADYETPQWFLDLVRRVGPIVLDPATTERNSARAQYIYTPGASPWDPKTCGLVGSWEVEGLVYCNPRYGHFLRGPVKPHNIVRDKHGVMVGWGTGWVRKMAQHRGEGLYLVPARPDTEWWRELYAWSELQLFWSSAEHGSRIHFSDPRQDGAIAMGSNLPSSVFYRGPRRREFADVFGPHGTLLPGGALSLWSYVLRGLS